MNYCLLFGVVWAIAAAVFQYSDSGTAYVLLSVAVSNIWLCGNAIITRLERKK